MRGVKLPPGPAAHLKWHMRVRLLTYPDASHVKREAAEFRALLAVAGAAKHTTCVRAASLIASPARARELRGAEMKKALLAQQRALARLDRASRTRRIA